MKLHLDSRRAGQNIIRSYSSGEIVINDACFTRSLIVTPEKVIDDWAPQSFAELAPQHLELLAQPDAEIVILGTGTSLQFPRPMLLQGLANAGIGHEIMDTAAACRTFNILMSEGRRVVAGLLMID